jgi:hypothetical protein
MKFLFFSLIFSLFFTILNSIFAFAQCATEPTIEQTGKIVAARDFTVKDAPGEMILTLEAAARDTSWAKVGAEGAALTVFVDGKYNQDIILFAGAEKFAYPVALGNFERGKHKIAVLLNESRSAKKAKAAKIYSIDVSPVNSSAKAFADVTALANSPFIYARPDTIDKFSDIPLFTYYEIFPNGENDFKIRYTTVFSNEDGGTQTAALMARWGRATDIEWVYEIEVKDRKIVSQIFQAANHETKNYAGKRVFGTHPLIFNQTVNNNFADAGCSQLRFAPLAAGADLSKKSRESLMDENGWTYRIMAEELLRENRVNAEKLDANTIADPRDYLYAEIYGEPTNAAVNIEVETSGKEKFSSDAGIAALRVNRKGYLRVALRLPRKTVSEFPPSVIVGCHPISSNDSPGNSDECQNVRVVKLVRLGENYQPLVKKIESAPQTIKTGEKAVFVVSAD